jgi:hypothetical protein
MAGIATHIDFATHFNALIAALTDPIDTLVLKQVLVDISRWSITSPVDAQPLLDTPLFKQGMQLASTPNVEKKRSNDGADVSTRPMKVSKEAPENLKLVMALFARMKLDGAALPTPKDAYGVIQRANDATTGIITYSDKSPQDAAKFVSFLLNALVPKVCFRWLG